MRKLGLITFLYGKALAKTPSKNIKFGQAIEGEKLGNESPIKSSKEKKKNCKVESQTSLSLAKRRKENQYQNGQKSQTIHKIWSILEE